MNILIFYTPRSKSTMIGKVLANKFHLDYCESPLTISRLSNKNFNEYPQIIEKINSTNNGCVKICANDFVDLFQKSINEDYKKINFNIFDHIIFLTRESMLDAVLSFGYMDSSNRSSWHRKQGEEKEIKPYSIVPARIFNLLRGYSIFNKIKEYISQNTTAKLYDCEYDTVEESLSKQLSLNQDDFKIELIPNGVPYKDIVLNYEEVLTNVNGYKANMSNADFNNPDSFFWRH